MLYTILISCITLPLIASEARRYDSAIPSIPRQNESFNRLQSTNYMKDDLKTTADLFNSFFPLSPLKPNGLLSLIVGTSIGLYNAHLYEKYSDRLRWHWIVKWLCFSISREIFTEGFIHGSAGLIDRTTCKVTARLADWIYYLTTCFTHNNHNSQRCCNETE